LSTLRLRSLMGSEGQDTEPRFGLSSSMESEQSHPRGTKTHTHTAGIKGFPAAPKILRSAISSYFPVNPDGEIPTTAKRTLVFASPNYTSIRIPYQTPA
jgi:hypothetical protein